MLRSIARAVFLLLVFACLGACSEDLGLDQEGRPVSSEMTEKHWLIINYWAEWCAPCRREIPELNRLAEQLERKAVRILGVNFDGLTGDELLQASRRMHIGYPVLRTDPARKFGLAANEALPATYIVTPDRRRHIRLMGEQSADSLLEQLQALGFQ